MNIGELETGGVRFIAVTRGLDTGQQNPNSTPNPSIVGQSVIITATVTPSTATGTVSVFDVSSALITNLPLSGGKASFSVPNLSVGTHAITGTYSGDGNNGGGPSGVLMQIVTDH